MDTFLPYMLNMFVQQYVSSGVKRAYTQADTTAWLSRTQRQAEHMHAASLIDGRVLRFPNIFP
jgi:hypothetical protein